MRPSVRAILLPTVLLGLPVGIALGIGGYTFTYANGGSYLTNDPSACANCHVMQDHFDAWTKSSHHSFATCNDCHTPASLVPKYVTKALNGWHHSRAFTTGNFHEPIEITERNRTIVESQCRSCHGEIVEAIEHDSSGSCIRCHASVGHLR
jgi:cytochrome c nitrite reductase small subunit